MPHTSGQPFEQLVREALPDTIAIAFGIERPDPAAYDVLVHGVPDADDLRASEALHTVVIPWAGVATKARETLLAFPHLTVCNLHHNAASTAETAVGLLLAAARRLVPADRALRRGDWSLRFEHDASLRLSGRTAVVLGMGAIGSRVARTLQAMDMQVTGVARRARPGDVLHVGVEDLDRVLKNAHVLVVAVAATPETKGIVDAKRLSLLAPGAIVVNVSRGFVVEEEALFEALQSGDLGGAGLDVWYRYPRTEVERTNTLPSKFSFHELGSVVLSPHRAGHDGDTDRCRAEALVETLMDIASGNGARNVVDVGRGY